MSAFDRLNGAQKACAIVGGQSKLARALTERGLKITPQAISEWAGEKAIVVSQITGLSLHELNSSAYPSAEYSA